MRRGTTAVRLLAALGWSIALAGCAAQVGQTPGFEGTTDAAAGATDAVHLARDPDRVGDDADKVRRVNDVERVIRKRGRRRVHLVDPTVVQLLRGNPRTGLLEHVP